MNPLSLYGHAVAFQSFGVKTALQEDFPGTLAKLFAMGYSEVELCSFTGFAGDPLRGDFGKLADLTAVEIRRTLADAGLRTGYCQFRPHELAEERIHATMEWAAAVGITHFSLVDVYFQNKDWQAAFDLLNRRGEQLRENGFRLALHTPNDLWTENNGETAFDAVLRQVPIENCSIQLDLSATLLNGIDPGECLASHPGRFCAIHLRDGVMPTNEFRYIPALPLGEGLVDFKAVFAGARKSGVDKYIVEMAVFPPVNPIDAYRASADFIRTIGA